MRLRCPDDAYYNFTIRKLKKNIIKLNFGVSYLRLHLFFSNFKVIVFTCSLTPEFSNNYVADEGSFEYDGNMFFSFFYS